MIQVPSLYFSVEKLSDKLFCNVHQTFSLKRGEGVVRIIKKVGNAVITYFILGMVFQLKSGINQQILGKYFDTIHINNDQRHDLFDAALCGKKSVFRRNVIFKTVTYSTIRFYDFATSTRA